MNFLGIIKKVKTGGLIFGAFAAGLASTYFTINKRTQVVDLGMPEKLEEAVDNTYFGKFVSKLTPIISNEEMEEAFNLEANFKDFVISWPNNEIKIDGQLDLSLRSLLDLNFSLDVDVNYNGKEIDLGVGLFDKTLYVATKDLRLKTSFVDRSRAKEEVIEAYDKIYNLFFDLENNEGLQIDFQLQEIIDSLLGGLDLSSLTSSLGDFSITETEDETYAFSELAIGLGETNLNLLLTFDKENESLAGVDLGTLQFGDLSISGGLTCKSGADVKVVPFDDEQYSYKQRGEFIETFNYINWIDDIFNLLKTRQIGLDISGSLTEGNKSYGVINLSADLDATRFKPLDIAGMVIGPELFGLTNDTKAENSQDYIEKTDEISGDLDILELINNFDFNVNVELSNFIENTLVDYSNINLAYFKDADENNVGYLSLNDEENSSVMRAKINTETINYIIDTIPNIIQNIETTKISKQAQEKPGLFDFVTSSALITAIESGCYDTILDVLKNIQSTKNEIVLTLGLNSLGFGDNSEVVLKLDASDTENRKVISLDINNAIIGGKTLQLSLNTRKFEGSDFERINQIRETYDNLDFVNGTLDQLDEITGIEKLGFTVNGSVLDEKSLGFDFDGWAQLDYNALNGMGSITLNEYKYESGKKITPHTVDISIDDIGADHAKNNMYFEYRDALKGRFTLKTFDDIFDLIKTLINANDERFTKFLDPILSKLAESIVYNAIMDENYFALAQSSLVTNISQKDNGKRLDITLSKQMLLNLVEQDLTISINFVTIDGKRRIDGISIKDFTVADKNINLELKIAEFDAEKENPVNFTGNFLDFSDIAVLLEFGINTTELNVYHLAADAKVNFKLFTETGITLLNSKLDFYVYVNGGTTKVYGKLPDNKLKAGYSEFVFEPSHNENDKIGGIFHIYRYVNGTLSTLYQPQIYYYYADSKTFLDNIIQYLVGDFIGLGTGLTQMIERIDLTSSSEKNPKWEKTVEASTTFPAFSYYTDNETINQWQVRVNLAAITEISVLNAVEATITGGNYGGKDYLSRIVAKANIADILPINLDLQLVDPNPSQLDWPSEIENRYQQIISIYDGLSAKKQTSAKNPQTGVQL